MLTEKAVRTFFEKPYEDGFPFMLNQRCYVLELREITPQEYYQLSKKVAEKLPKPSSTL